MPQRMTIVVSDDMAPAVRELAASVESEKNIFDLSEGDAALDRQEPTPSPELNTVRVTAVTDQNAASYTIEETGKTVSEHNPVYPPTDRVVIGYYPHMGGSNKTFAFPESRLAVV